MRVKKDSLRRGGPGTDFGHMRRVERRYLRAPVCLMLLAACCLLLGARPELFVTSGAVDDDGTSAMTRAPQHSTSSL